MYLRLIHGIQRYLSENTANNNAKPAVSDCRVYAETETDKNRTEIIVLLFITSIIKGFYRIIRQESGSIKDNINTSSFMLDICGLLRKN